MSGRRVARHRLGGSFLLGRLAGAQAVKFDHRFRSAAKLSRSETKKSSA
jgi:hypothetical protein